MNNRIGLILIFSFFFITVNSQELLVSAELKPRFEARHGFGTLASPEDDAALFVSQRARINFGYKTDKYEVFFAVQNVSVWGDVSTLSPSDKNGTSFHQMYGVYHFTPRFAMKLGRQEISYDDLRIFGSVDWAQQARSHDALLFQIKPGDNSKLDVGFALNANSETLFAEDYLVNQYKSMQYAWFHTDFSSDLGLSLLFLNNGLPYNQDAGGGETDQKTTYSQTLGGRLTWKKERFNIDAATYFQGGNTPNSAKTDAVDLSAYYFSANANFKIINGLSLGAGFELISGTDQGSDNDKIKAFNPFYGTNHKFNGWMDYFYVGNHINNVGLVDFYTPIVFKQDKARFRLIPHFFSADGRILDPAGGTADSYLGTEIDFEFSYTLVKNVMLVCGYSQMFATESMEIIKGGSKDETNNWGWIMITFKPTFFKKKFEP